MTNALIMDDGQGSYVMDKREARKEFKLRTTPKGIFAVRCLASGDVWVSATDHLDSARNGVWFQLRNGLHQNKTLQAVWNAHGEGGFEFEVLETLPEDVSPQWPLEIYCVNDRNTGKQGCTPCRCIRKKAKIGGPSPTKLPYRLGSSDEMHQSRRYRALGCCPAGY